MTVETLIGTPDPDDNENELYHSAFLKSFNRSLDVLRDQLKAGKPDVVRLRAAEHILDSYSTDEIKDSISQYLVDQDKFNGSSAAFGLAAQAFPEPVTDNAAEVTTAQPAPDAATTHIDPDTYALTSSETIRGSVIMEARDLITGDRNISYGTPTQNFTNIAEMWSTRLRHKLLPGEEITPTDVADLMILLKVARNIASIKRDSYVDLAGYAGCGWEAHVESSGLSE